MLAGKNSLSLSPPPPQLVHFRAHHTKGEGREKKKNQQRLAVTDVVGHSLPPSIVVCHHRRFFFSEDYSREKREAFLVWTMKKVAASEGVLYLSSSPRSFGCSFFFFAISVHKTGAPTRCRERLINLASGACFEHAATGRGRRGSKDFQNFNFGRLWLFLWGGVNVWGASFY